MKVTCQSCQAKYTIADEKVRGKVAKIRCKKCGTTIIVDGNDPVTAAGVAEQPPSGPVADYTQQGSSDEQWTVLVADGDQRTLTAAQVAELYASGTVGFETLVWKDGMADWQAIAQTDALRSVLENGPRPTMTPLEMAATAPSAPPSGPPAAEAPAARAAPVMAARPKAAEPTAARRPGRAGGADLFGAATQEDVLTSALDGGAAHHGGDGGADKLTGARNENSVLFSLSALTGSGERAPTAAAERDPASNKADLRALMGSSGGGAPARSKIDDIMNLSGGGVYSPGMMAAPALAPPTIDMMTAAVPSDSGGSKSKSLMMAIGGGVLVIGAVAIAFTTMSSKDDATDKTAAAASGAVGTNALGARGASNTTNEGPGEPAAAPGEPVRHGETTKPADTPPTETAPAAVAPGSPAPKPEAEKSDRVERKAAAPKSDKPAAATPPAGLPPPPVAAPAPAPAAPAPAAPAAGGSGDFDRAAALSALSAAATAAQSCKKPDGPTGSGRIAVTFANNGTATTANVEGPPFAGTPVGGCVAARFRSVHIPPFGGSVITVRKTFIIN
jgi:predicted Zn finger-like uncharacterized protein